MFECCGNLFLLKVLTTSLYIQCNTTLPSVILTNRYLVVMNAVLALFSSAITLICIWHANKAVLACC